MTYREPLQQALEALELIATCAERAIGCSASEMDGYLAQISECAIARVAAIRARLAEPIKEASPEDMLHYEAIAENYKRGLAEPADTDARVQRVMAAADGYASAVADVPTPPTPLERELGKTKIEHARAEIERVVRESL